MAATTMSADGNQDNSMLRFKTQTRNLIFNLLAAFFVIYLLHPQQALATFNEQIEFFQSNIKINKDASINVTETITYNFGPNQKHGIYRTIPYKYKARGGNYSTDITDIKVTNVANNPYQTKIKKEGRNLKIRIGDPDKYVSGQKTYLINYTVTSAINFFEQHEELYWNITGNEWEVPIKQAYAFVALPLEAANKEIKTACFAGQVNSNNPCKNTNTKSLKQTESKLIKFEHNNIKPGEGMTIVAGIPKGIINEPTWWEKTIKIIKDNWIALTPLITIFVLYYLWRTRGRDPKGRGAIPAQYDPPKGLSPSQAGTIVDEKADNVDISADIIHLAINGYLKIKRLEEKKLFGKKIDYELTKLNKPDTSLNQTQKMLLNGLFSNNKQTVKLSDLQNKFYKDLTKIRKNIYQSLVDRKYFPHNPHIVRVAYSAIGLSFGIFGAFLSHPFFGYIGLFSFAISGFLIGSFSIIMPVKTKRGVLTKEYILGLKRYITVAEKERIKFHNAPAKSPELFDRLLPYAMIFKAEKQWAKQFRDIYTKPPNWYEGPAGTNFNTVILASSLSDFSATAKNTLASKPSSAAGGGSGFSGGGVGGGFGGGGGGSW